MKEKKTENENKRWWIRYLVCFCVGLVIAFGALAIQGFFADGAKMNMQILHNAFFASGAFLMLFAGLLYVSDEGAFLGIGYALGRVVEFLLPFYRKNPENYAEYRERKLGKQKTHSKRSVFLIGLFFFIISIVFLTVWALL